MTRPTIQELVDGTGELATLPSTVIRLLDLLRDADTCATEVQVVLERDPAMTANILKLSNSAYYGVRRTISTVRDALVLLGNRAVTTLAFATGMSPVLRRDLSGYGMGRDEFWGHCLTTAAASSLAADLRGDTRWRCQAFTAGLVHDIGMLVIDSHLSAEREQLPAAGDDMEQCRLEIDHFGYDHAEVGGALAEAWGFPTTLTAAITHHHNPGRALGAVEITRAVAAGDLVADALSRHPGRPWSPEVTRALTGMGFDPTDFGELALDLATDLDETLAGAATPPEIPV
ncbi:MAG: HDOD domain-containing protein [bacterium]|nr:HDOD domain-containing protein [bacterium]